MRLASARWLLIVAFAQVFAGAPSAGAAGTRPAEGTDVVATVTRLENAATVMANDFFVNTYI